MPGNQERPEAIECGHCNREAHDPAQRYCGHCGWGFPPDRNVNTPVLHDRKFREAQSPVWDMSQERAFFENLHQQRFNFFMVFFGLVVAGSVNARLDPFYFRSILILGAFVSVAIGIATMRSARKMNVIMEYIYADPSHPASIVDVESKKWGRIEPRFCKGSAVHLILRGRRTSRKSLTIVVTVCCGALTIAAIMSIFWYNTLAGV